MSLECSQDRQLTDGTGAIETFALPNKQKVEHDIVKKALLVAAGCGHIEVGALLSSLEITALETFQAMFFCNKKRSKKQLVTACTLVKVGKELMGKAKREQLY